jgi:hypothetical protein
MRKKMPKIAIPPISIGYLTEGKEYEMFKIEDGALHGYNCEYIFKIQSDRDITMFCLSENCAHLGGRNWKLI